MWRSVVAIRHPGRSLIGRLMAFVLLTTATALLVAATALLVTDLYQDRTAWSEQLESGANILALASAPALAFDDRAAAQRALAALAAQPTIRAAAIYDARGTRIAHYARAGMEAAPLQRPVQGAGLHLSGTSGELVQPVMQSGERLGTVYLRARYQVAGRVITYVEVLALVMLAGLVAAMLTAGWLQRAITSPMDSIAHVARQIVEGRTYALRAGKTGHDEFAIVVDAFNNMLGEVQLRTQALEQSNQALKEAAAVRQAAEQALLASERLYRAIGESINYGVWVCDAQGNNSYASDSFLALTGLTLEGYCQPSWIEVVHPEDRAQVRADWQECVRTGGLWYHEHRIRDVHGQYQFILAQGVPIRDDQGRIERWAGIHLDIARLKSTEQALREADRRKDEFLATLAHELRNPLAPIRNAVFILNSPGANDRQRQGARDVIDRQVRHMSLLLDDLLDVSRVTRGQFGLKKEFVDLKMVCEMAIETARPVIQAKQHALSVRLPEQALTIEADPLRLAQVISNLLTNAAKYTDAGGRIELEVALRTQELTLVVRDNGIGLSPESLPNLFTMFSQVDSSIDRAQGGLGIGLALVKGLVELHGGRVSAASAGLGQGSEFTVRLPGRVIAQEHAVVLPVVGNGGQGLRLDAPRLMVVDDNRDAAETLSLALSFDGFRVITAHSGAQALELGAREHPQAVVLDVGMPGMDGYETVRRLRAESWGRNAVVIALTGWGQDQDKQDARAAGFDEHLTKPVDLSELAELLTRQLTARRLAAESRLRALAHS
ncbi:MAG: response regulator [Gammaproteobacteria bacterium]|nr:response regulator [Gammaproteobacteria bacterium]